MQQASRFLIVDDSNVDRMVNNILIRHANSAAEVAEASGGRAALSLVPEMAVGHNLVILLDIRMPGMDGFQFLDEFAKLPEAANKNITIMMLSSSAAPEDIKRAESNPLVAKILTKPLPVDELKMYLA